MDVSGKKMCGDVLALTRSGGDIVAIILLHTSTGEVISLGLILLQCRSVSSTSSIQQHLHTFQTNKVRIQD